MKLTQEHNNILTLLAKRQNHNDDNISNWNYLIGINQSRKAAYFRCLICNKQIYNSLINNHGLDHLKEKNLLAFV